MFLTCNNGVGVCYSLLLTRRKPGTTVGVMRGTKTTYKGIYKLDDSVYRVCVHLGRDPLSNKYRERTETFRGLLKDALMRQSEMRIEVQQQREVTSHGSLNQLCERYLEHAKETLSPSTLRSYHIAHNSKIKVGIGERPARKITTEELDSFFQKLKRDGNLKGQTVNRVRTFLLSVYKQGVVWKWVSYNPVVGTTLLRQERYDYKPVNLEDIESVLAEYELINPAMGDFLKLSMLNQLRRGECCGLQVGDFDLSEKTLMIRRSIVELNKSEGSWAAKETKTNHDRMLDIDPLSVEIIERRIVDLQRDLPAGKYVTPESFLFSSNGGKTPWRPGRVTLSQGRVRARLGVSWRVHDLRAYTTTMLLKAGVDSKIVQQRGGWSSETVMRTHYNRFMRESSQKAIDAITQTFGKAGTSESSETDAA